jgi:hypothetical protein
MSLSAKEFVTDISSGLGACVSNFVSGLFEDLGYFQYAVNFCMYNLMGIIITFMTCFVLILFVGVYLLKIVLKAL